MKEAQPVTGTSDRPSRSPEAEMSVRIRQVMCSSRMHTRLMSRSATHVLGSCSSDTAINRCLREPTAYASRLQFAALSCRHISSSGSLLSRTGFANRFAYKVPIRYFATQPEASSPNTNGGDNKSQLCEKIGFIGAGKIAQVRK